MPRTNKNRRACRRGMSLIELLISLAILLVIMVGVAGLLESSWQSFSDLKWQNRVDSEARRALDSISDAARVSGYQVDFYNSFSRRKTAPYNYNTNVDIYSSDSAVNLVNNYNNNNSTENFFLQSSVNDPTLGYIEHTTYGIDNMSAIYITNVHFAYAYREVSQPGDTQWTFNTVQGLKKNQPATDPTNGAIFYTVKTIYITVTASYNPYPNSIDSRTYTRTLTGAVTLRAPYNTPLPPAQTDGP